MNPTDLEVEPLNSFEWTVLHKKSTVSLNVTRRMVPLQIWAGLGVFWRLLESEAHIGSLPAAEVLLENITAHCRLSQKTGLSDAPSVPLFFIGSVYMLCPLSVL